LGASDIASTAQRRRHPPRHNRQMIEPDDVFVQFDFGDTGTVKD
jgi:hypothetical protein